MEWFDVAINIEVEGEKFYRDLSGKAAAEGMKNIFSMLADDELKHKETFEAMKQGKTPEPAASVTQDEAKKVFKTFKKQDFLDEQKQLELYRKVLDIEKKSIDFYADQLGTVEDEKHRKTLEQIIGEEQSHFKLIDSIIIMVERPESWVEHAEFGLREDY